MWQFSTPTMNKHQTAGYHPRPINSSKYKYTVPSKQYDSACTLKESSELQSIMAPHPPITLPSLHDHSKGSINGSLTYTPSYKPISQILGLSHGGTVVMTPPEQINANSHTEYTPHSSSSFPSTFHLFHQINNTNCTAEVDASQDSVTVTEHSSIDHSVHSVDTTTTTATATTTTRTHRDPSSSITTKTQPNKKEKEKKKHKRRQKHKRARTKVRLHQSSIPPPPTIGCSQSVPPKRDRDRSRSFTNSSFDAMQPIPEHFDMGEAHHSAHHTQQGTVQSNAVLIEVDELDELEEERMAIHNARKKLNNNNNKRVSTSTTTLQQDGSSTAATVVINSNKKMESNLNSFWEHNRRIPFIGLAMATSTFFILVFIYFTNLFRFLFGGLVPCLIGLIMIVPIYYFFRKYDVTLQYKSVLIEDHIAEEKRLTEANVALGGENRELSNKTEDLTTRLLRKLDIIGAQKTQIRELNQIIAERKAADEEEAAAAERNRRQSMSASYLSNRSGSGNSFIQNNNNNNNNANHHNNNNNNNQSSSRHHHSHHHKTRSHYVGKKHSHKSHKKFNLLRGFLRGEMMESQLESADINDLVHMLPIVTSCITLMPFGMSQTRRKFQRILESKISNNPYLAMQFYLFLVSFLGCLDVSRLFRKHKMMKSASETCNFYKYSWDDMMEKCGYLNAGDRVYSVCCVSDDAMSDKDSMEEDSGDSGSMATLNVLSSPTGTQSTHNSALGADIYGQCSQALAVPAADATENAVVIECEETVVFSERDPVKLFRMPLDRNAAVGFTVLVANKLRNRFFDPINGNACVEQLKVRKIFNSNARPYLIDCYCVQQQPGAAAEDDDDRDDIIMDDDEMYLSSSYILKRGDDLRKDGAVLKMFEFMNLIWRTNELAYKEAFVSSLIYKCIPIGPDVGIIQVIPNCIELNKVMSLRHKLRHKENRHLYNKLVASAAGAFIAAFVMGIRDRHDDNILINQAHDGYNLFHIDFGYMFGDRVPALDTSKLAITSGLKNVFDIYDDGWNDFIDVCIKSWLILRNNANQLIDYARLVFAFLYQTNQIEMFLRDSLKLDIVDDDIAAKYLNDKLKNAPKHLKTKVKNLVHGFAQKIK